MVAGPVGCSLSVRAHGGGEEIFQRQCVWVGVSYPVDARAEQEAKTWGGEGVCGHRSSVKRPEVGGQQVCRKRKHSEHEAVSWLP